MGKKERRPSLASTASGGDQNLTPEVPSPEVETTSGTASPELTDSESDFGVFRIVNDPKGKQHDLLRHRIDDDAVACKPLDFPLGFRRVLSAVLPPDCEASLRLSAGQMQRLSDLRNVVSAQKPCSSNLSAARVSQNGKRNTVKSKVRRSEIHQ